MRRGYLIWFRVDTKCRPRESNPWSQRWQSGSHTTGLPSLPGFYSSNLPYLTFHISKSPWMSLPHYISPTLSTMKISYLLIISSPGTSTYSYYMCQKIPFDLTILSLIRDHPCSPKNCFCCCPSFPSQQPSSHSYLNSLKLPRDPIGKLTSPIYKTLNSHTFPQNFAKITIITCSTTFPYKSFPPLS